MDRLVALQAGNFFMIFKKFDEVIRMYSSAIDLNPNLAEAYNNRDVFYKFMGKHDRARKNFNKARALDPNLFKDSP